MYGNNVFILLTIFNILLIITMYKQKEKAVTKTVDYI